MKERERKRVRREILERKKEVATWDHQDIKNIEKGPQAER